MSQSMDTSGMSMMTHDEKLLTKPVSKEAIFTDKTPAQVIEMPIFIGTGKTLVSSFDYFKKLELLGSMELPEGLVQLRYKVK